jgi:rRNA-processing protein FCF1
MKISKMKFLKDKTRTATGESITFVDVLERIYNKTRGQHNTAALLTAARQHKGVIVTHDKKWADTLKNDHGVDAMVYTDPKIWTYQGPVLMDLPCMFEFVKAHSRLEHQTTELLDYLDLKNVD